MGYRALRICWSEEFLEKRLDELEEDLVERGYGRRSIKSSVMEVRKISREQALKKVVIISATGEMMRIKDKLTCSSSNIIYMITCRRGGRVCPSHPQYIGETWKEAKERLRGHRGIITQPGVPFRAPGHSYADVSFIPI